MHLTLYPNSQRWILEPVPRNIFDIIYKSVNVLPSPVVQVIQLMNMTLFFALVCTPSWYSSIPKVGNEYDFVSPT